MANETKNLYAILYKNVCSKCSSLFIYLFIYSSTLKMRK